MRRGQVRIVSIAVAVMAAFLALRLVQQSFALSSATIYVGGEVQVGGSGTPYVTCALSPTALSMTKNQTQIVNFACTNNLPTSLTLSTTVGSWSPTNKAPTSNWLDGRTLNLASGASGTLRIRIQSSGNTNTSTFSFTVSGANADLGFSKSFSLPVTMN